MSVQTGGEPCMDDLRTFTIFMVWWMLADTNDHGFRSSKQGPHWYSNSYFLDSVHIVSWLEMDRDKTAIRIFKESQCFKWHDHTVLYHNLTHLNVMFCCWKPFWVSKWYMKIKSRQHNKKVRLIGNQNSFAYCYIDLGVISNQINQ